MSEPFLSEIRIFSFNQAPRGWALCNGQLLPINQNQALFALLGTTYGGNGQTNFALPNLQGRVPIHEQWPDYQLGQAAGAQTHTLTLSELPAHTHSSNGSTANADQPVPSGRVLAGALNQYGPPSNLTSLHASTITFYGSSQPHNNLMPYLALNFCICMIGLFPSPT